jgi:hypothetical protein
MKKSFSALTATAVVLMLGLAAFFASCGGGGGGGSSAPTITPISTPAQGAQSAKAAVSTFRSMSNAGSSLTGMAGQGGLPLAPQIKMPVSTGSASTAADKFAARFATVVKKAEAMRVSASGYPMPMTCDSGSGTIDMDASGTSMVMTSNNCRNGDIMTDGIMSVSGISQSSNSGSGNITVGSDADPFIVTVYSGATSTVIDEVITAVVGMTFTATGTSASDMSFTLSMTGYFDDVDHVAHTHERQVVNNLSLSGGTGSTTTIGSVSYDVATLTLNGTVTGTTYVSDTDQTVSYLEGPNTFTNVVIVDKSPAFGIGDEYFSIDGTITVSTTPARCIEGRFLITTNTPVQIDGTTGQTKAGQITINGNAVATFNSEGSVSVSVDGGAAVVYSRTELDSMCAL